jgi:transcriptional regulator with XRE-family HTH domain
MASSESPAVARRRVRLAVRAAREQASLTQGQVAEEMEWSHSKVMRIESGEVTIAPNDLRPLLTYLGVADRSVVDDLIQAAKISRRRSAWWDEPRFRDHLTPATRHLVQYEAGAAVIRHFQTMIVPGPLQIPSYAQAILDSYRHELSDEDIRVRVDTRMRRRETLLTRRDRPEILLLLDESVIRRRVGGLRVMGDQLTELTRLIRDKRVSIRILPFTVEGPLPLFGAYELYDLGGATGDTVLYRENHLADELVEDQVIVDRHLPVFEQLWNAAVDEPTTADMIADATKSFLADAPSADSRPRGVAETRPQRRRKTSG